MPEPTSRPWRIIHIDLAKGVPPVEADIAAAGAMLVFWWEDLPLGQVELDADRLPLPAGGVRDLALKAATPAVGDRLFADGFKAQLPEYAPPPLSPPSTEIFDLPEHPFSAARERVQNLEVAAQRDKVSLIICTRDRADDLRTCLKSLLDIERPPNEIIVVDNAPLTDATKRVAEELADYHLPIIYVLEERPGLSVARNSGIRASSGNIIAFTDDDVQVHPKWLARLCGAFTGPEVQAATGLVLPAELETEAQQMFQWNHGGYAWSYRALTFDQQFLDRTRWRGTPVWHIGAGASMAFRRRVFDELGGFDERLGAGASGCSEDSELWYRILTHGWTCRYEPASVVFHTHRRTLEGLERQLHDYMQGHVVALLAQYERAKHPGDLLRAGYWLPRYYGGWILRRMIGRKGGPSLLDAQVSGFLRGFSYYARHRNDPSVPAFDHPSSPNQA